MENELTQGKTPEKPEGTLESEADAETYMPLASGVGQRSTKTAQTLGKMNRWFGVAEDSSVDKTAPESESATTQTQGDNPAVIPAVKTQRELTRGALTSLMLLLIFIPLLGLLAFLYYDATVKIAALENNLNDFNRVASSTDISQFVTILSEQNVQIKQFKNEDNSPIGKFVLYTAGRLRWAISYGKLEPLENNQMYVAWLIPKPKPNEAERYIRLITLRDLKSGGGAMVLKESDFPLGFDVVNYSELIITIEPLAQEPKTPVGPRRFSIDLTKLAT